jgi:hypothetical protein
VQFTISVPLVSTGLHVRGLAGREGLGLASVQRDTHMLERGRQYDRNRREEERNKRTKDKPK